MLFHEKILYFDRSQEGLDVGAVEPILRLLFQIDKELAQLLDK